MGETQDAEPRVLCVPSEKLHGKQSVVTKQREMWSSCDFCGFQQDAYKLYINIYIYTVYYIYILSRSKSMQHDV